MKDQSKINSFSRAKKPPVGFPIHTGNTYQSLPIHIPASFLSATNLPPDLLPVKINKIDFKSTPLPEYNNLYAVVIDNVLSPSECTSLIQLAESSVPPPDEIISRDTKVTTGDSDSAVAAQSYDPWTPVLVNIGGGREVHQPDYRNSDRIILDSTTITSRLWSRIAALCPSIAEELKKIDGESGIIRGARKSMAGQTWDFVMLNQRMRFLRYGPGQFFHSHCDASYEVPWENLPMPPEGREKRRQRTLFTLHLYLNDSVEGLAEEGRTQELNYDHAGKGDVEKTREELVGGSTPFFSSDEKRRVDVYPRAGRILIFQHSGLLHSGDKVKKRG